MNHAPYLNKATVRHILLLIQHYTFATFFLLEAHREYFLYGALEYDIIAFGRCTNQRHIRIDAILKRSLSSVAYNFQFAELEYLFSALELPRFSCLLVRTVVAKFSWSASFKLPRYNVVA